MYKASHAPTSVNSEPKSARGVMRFVVPALAALLISAACIEAGAQPAPANPSRPTVFPRQNDERRGPRLGERGDSDQMGSREEMLRNVEIKRREQAYKENLERAKEGAALGAELREAYERAKAIGPSEQKKLGRLEKLARAIREQAGGDDDKEGVDVPSDPAASFVELEKLSEELNKKVEKTPRHVVSTSVINTANRLLGLIRHIRSTFK